MTSPKTTAEALAHEVHTYGVGRLYNCSTEEIEIIIAALRSAQPAAVADYEAVLADHRRLVRELDVALNGENAAQQASLCDIVAQVKDNRWKLTAAVAMEQIAQLALDQTSDDPQPGDWNDACEHIAKLIRQSATQPQREPAQEMVTGLEQAEKVLRLNGFDKIVLRVWWGNAAYGDVPD